MNVLFLTLAYPAAVTSNIYTDLLDGFVQASNKVWVVCQSERRNGKPTQCSVENGKTVLRVKTLNITGEVGMVEKGIATAIIDRVFLAAINKYFRGIKFDLILYSTPPITLAGCVKRLKKEFNAVTYLLLKDIFPQNAVDLGMMRNGGLLHRYFRHKEEQLYAISDHIGCMSQANVDFVLRHNPTIDPTIAHVLHNTIKVEDKPKNPARSAELRKKYGIPVDRHAFVYGGNLGQPQGISFLIECLKANEGKFDRFFVICGNGTEYPKLKAYVDESKPSNVMLINGLPKEEYEDFIQSCDVGLIFLDHRFTIPNFPSRLLSYLQNRMPVLACTDLNTDVGQVITEGGFGWWCESNSVECFTRTVDKACCADLPAMGNTGYAYLAEHYTVEKSYQIIMEKMK